MSGRDGSDNEVFCDVKLFEQGPRTGETKRPALSRQRYRSVWVRCRGRAGATPALRRVSSRPKNYPIAKEAVDAVTVVARSDVEGDRQPPSTSRPSLSCRPTPGTTGRTRSHARPSK
jgi:hypothetical protein